MKKNILIFLLLLVIAALSIFIFTKDTAMAPTTPNNDQAAGRSMSIEQYITEHISELSPQSAVLGGTFYVTEVEVDGGTGTVRYEDGHIALEADFTYTIDEQHGAITITSFVVRE